MKKYNLISAILLCSFIFFVGCNKKTDELTQLPENSTQSTQTQESESKEDSSTDLPLEEGMVRSPLTNEWVSEEVANLRPLAVMIPNEKSAIPHYNISKADVLYECLVEGEISRLMAVFGDWSDLERIGNLRSARDYFVYWAFEWDAIYVHAGGPFYIDEVISRKDTNSINALTAPSSVFFRTTDRSAPHNLYFDGKDILKEASRLNYSLTTRDTSSTSNHFNFADASTPNTLEQYTSSVSASKIDLAAAYPVTKTWFEYNEDDKLYYRFQGTSNGAHMDAATNTQLSFSNVIIQFTYHEVRDAKGYLAFQCIDDTRDGWLFTNGRAIRVTWEKSSDYGATKYYDDKGNEVELNTGKTMICIVQDGDTFTYK